MKIKTVIVLVVFGFLTYCSTQSKKNTDVNVEYLPVDQVEDVTRQPSDYLQQIAQSDTSDDQSRNEGQFNFATVLKTRLKLKVNLFDIKKSIATGEDPQQSNETISAVVIVKNNKNGKVVFIGKTDASGNIDIEISVIASFKNCVVEIVHSKYHKRTLDIPNFNLIAVLNRVISMGRSHQSEINQDLVDRDGDLIPDVYDAFPDDEAKAFKTSFPEDDFLTVAFEDNFPNLGDGDYNDFIARYQITKVTNAQNKVVEMFVNSEAMVKMAGYDHRFGIVINFNDSPTKAEVKVYHKKYFGVYGVPKKIKDPKRLDITFFKRTSKSFTTQTINGASYKYGDSAVAHIVFTQPIEDSKIDSLPFDPYLYIYNTKYDIHLLGKDRLRASKNPPHTFFSGFRDSNGFPRALLVPASWAPPKETNHIENAYTQFKLWRESLGQTNSNWYLQPNLSETVSITKPFTINDQTFPSIELIPNTVLNNIDWSLGSGVGGCSLGDILNGENWQVHALCVFGINENDNNYNRTELNSKDSAVDFVQSFEMIIREKGALTNLTQLQILEKLIQVMTLKNVNSSDLIKLETALVVDGFEATFTSLLSKWYNSASYSTSFDFSNNVSYGKSWLVIAGNIKDNSSNGLSSSTIKVLVSQDSKLLTELNSDTTGNYNGSVLIPDLFFNSTINLNVIQSGFQEAVKTIIPKKNTANQVDFILRLNGDISEITGGNLSSTTNNIKVNFPAGATNSDTTFNVTSLVLNTDPQQPLVKTKEFSILPSYEFNKPVEVSVVIDDSLIADLGANRGELSLFILEDGKLKEIETSFYDSVTQTLSAKVVHFSTFVIRSSCSVAQCVVQPVNSSTLAKTLTGPQKVVFPSGIQSFKTSYTQILQQNGWDPTSFDRQFDSLLLSLGDACPQANCSELNIDVKSQIANEMPISFYQSGVSVGSINVVSARVTGNIVLDIQSEYCSVNPYTCDPKFRLNQVDSSNLNLTIVYQLNNVRIGYSVWEKTGQKCWWKFCSATYGWRTHTDTFSHTVTVVLNGLNQKIIRGENLNSIVKWQLGSTLNSGDIITTLSSEVETTPYRKIYGSIVESRIKNSTQELKSQLDNAIINNLNASTYKDPDFNDDNCLNVVGGNLIGGIVTGLDSGEEVELSLNGLFKATLTSEGSFSFIQKLGNNTSYLVEILTTPEGKGCLIQNESGVVTGNISNINITCDELFPSSIGPGITHTCAVVNGSAQCWGENNWAQLGDGSLENSLVPVNVLDLTFGVTEITTSERHSCAIANNSAYCWGAFNNFTFFNRTPEQLLDLPLGTLQNINSGFNHNCMTISGVAYCWGSDDLGQLGNGLGIFTSNTPFPVSNLGSNVSKISANGNTTCAISAGVAYCWGQNTTGQLGNGTTIDSHTPVAVSGLGNNVSDISQGVSRSCAVVGGSAYCWGDNTSGRLGNGSPLDSLVPVPVTGLSSNVTQVSAGAGHSCAIVDSSAFCWGSNHSGALGNTSYPVNSTVPVPVMGLPFPVSNIEAGFSHTCATANGLIYCWGRNDLGQLGDGTTVQKSIPTLVNGFIQ